MVHVPLTFLSEWGEFPSAPCLEEKKNLMTARVTMLLKSRASLDMLPFSFCNKKKTCNSAHEKTRISNNAIDSVLRYREVAGLRTYQHPFVDVCELGLCSRSQICPTVFKIPLRNVYFANITTVGQIQR